MTIARRFTTEEDAFIRSHHETQTLAWIARRLDRDDSTIGARCRQLGLPKKSPGRPPTPQPPKQVILIEPPASHPAILEPSMISLPTRAQLMAGSASPRPRIYRVEA